MCTSGGIPISKGGGATKYSPVMASRESPLIKPVLVTDRGCAGKVLRRLIAGRMAVDKASITTNSAWLPMPKSFPTVMHKTISAKSYKQANH